MLRRMAASLPYPALHATHGGIWIAHADGAGRGGRARRGDRAGGRDADDHAERAAGRQPARLSRPVRPRPARAVRLRPSGALRGADAQGPRPRARPRRARATTRRPRLPARGGGGAARDARAATGPSAKAPGPRRRRSGRLRWPWAPARSAQRLRRPERDERWLFSQAARMGGERRRARSRAPVAARRADDGRTGSSGWSASGAEAREGQRDYAAAAAAVFAPRARRGPAQPAARRGRHRDRQDAGLSRPRLALGGAGRRRGLGLDLHQGAAAPARPRGRCGSSPIRPSARRKVVDPQGPRELSLPAQPRGRAAGRLRRPRRDPRAAGRALGGLLARTATWSAATCRAG